MEELGKNPERLPVEQSKAKTVFEFHPFRLLTEDPILMRDGSRVKLTPKALAVLVQLVLAKGRPVRKEALSKAVWPEEGTDDNNLTRHVAMVRHALGEGFIETVPRLGYRFSGPFVESLEPMKAEVAPTDGQPLATLSQPLATSEDVPVSSAASVPSSATTDSIEPSQVSNADGTWWWGGQRWHLLWVCAFYAALYAIALILEVAYGFDRFGNRALALSPLVGGWILLTTWLAVAYCWRKSKAGTRSSLGLLVGVVVGAALTLSVSLFAFLPGNPVTAMVTPAQTAQAAYLKNTAFYFLPLAILVWLIPFHFVCCLNREFSKGDLAGVVALLRHERGTVSPEGTVYLRPDLLVKGLVVLGVVCVIATHDLLGRLKPGPYQNLFMLLAILRSLCAFAFCLSSVLWYRKALDSFLRRSVAAQEVSLRDVNGRTAESVGFLGGRSATARLGG